MKRLDNCSLFSGGPVQWLTTNVWDGEEDTFFQELFSRTTVKTTWQWQDSYYIGDDAAVARWLGKLSGDRTEHDAAEFELPDIRVPSRSISSGKKHVTRNAARSI